MSLITRRHLYRYYYHSCIFYCVWPAVNILERHLSCPPCSPPVLPMRSSILFSICLECAWWHLTRLSMGGDIYSFLTFASGPDREIEPAVCRLSSGRRRLKPQCTTGTKTFIKLIHGAPHTITWHPLLRLSEWGWKERYPTFGVVSLTYTGIIKKDTTFNSNAFIKRKTNFSLRNIYIYIYRLFFWHSFQIICWNTLGVWWF